MSKLKPCSVKDKFEQPSIYEDVPLSTSDKTADIPSGQERERIARDVCLLVSDYHPVLCVNAASVVYDKIADYVMQAKKDAVREVQARTLVKYDNCNCPDHAMKECLDCVVSELVAQG